MNFELPQNVVYILTTLEEAGHEAYVVGGCVRDIARGVEPKDWDICTSALPEQTQSCFKDYPLIATGLKHGTLTLVLNAEHYEITTYRSDGVYSDGRRPDEVHFVKSLREDLARRDLTINAMAYNPRVGLVDPFGGMGDLDDKLIRAVGKPAERFKEDALRIMRALRFASVLGFSIEEDTSLALLDNRQLLDTIAAERIAVELVGILMGSNVEHVLLEYAPVLAVPLPEIEDMVGFDQKNPYHIYDVWQHTVRSVACASFDKKVRLTMLLHDIGKPSCYTEADGRGHFYGHPRMSESMARQILNRLRFDKDTISSVCKLVFYHDAQIEAQEKCLKRWLNRLGEERLRQLLEVKRADASAQAPQYKDERLQRLDTMSELLDRIVEQQQCFSRKDLAVDGRDLIALGVSEGAEIGRILNDLLDKVIEEELANDKNDLLAYVEQLRRSDLEH